MDQLTPKEPLTNLETLLAHWIRILAAGDRTGRALWLLFHRDDGRIDDHLLVVEELPLSPDHRAIESLEAVVRSTLDTNPDCDHCVIMVSRPGTQHRSPFEIEWTTALSALSDVMVWPVCCGTPHGVEPVNLP